jgi:hypothetical protein
LSRRVLDRLKHLAKFMNEIPKSSALEKKKLKLHEHVMAGLPFALIAVGGLIGGAIGGGAYAINASIFTKEISPAKKYTYCILVTLGACAAYFGVIVALALIFPDLFGK